MLRRPCLDGEPGGLGTGTGTEASGFGPRERELAFLGPCRTEPISLSSERGLSTLLNLDHIAVVAVYSDGALNARGLHDGRGAASTEQLEVVV
jgi:hypothetical protein